ncbi:histidine kinase [Runella sp.]|uniref:sensor histidine kinase n=1 Tax=Runella sp. TaxID=1960881 RepID=UPI003D0E419C
MAQLPDISFEHISTKQGLPSNDVWSAAKDKQGFMWFGSSRSFCRYDGYNFDTFEEAASGYSTGVSVDHKSGRIYACNSAKGLCAIDPKDLSVKVVLPINYADKKLENNHYDQVLVDSHEQVWSCDLLNVKRYDPVAKKITLYPLPASGLYHQISRFFEDSGHTLWAVSDIGLYRYDRKSDRLVCQIGAEAANPKNRRPLRLWSASEDSSRQQLWIACHDGCLLRYTPSTDTAEYFSKGIENQNVTCVQEGVDENHRKILFVGTKYGLSVFRPDEKRFYHFADFYEKATHVKSMYDDKANGILWITTTEGLYKYRYQNIGIRVLNLPKNLVTLPVGVMCFANGASENEVFMGLSHTGVLRWDRRENRFQLYRYPVSAYTHKLRFINAQLWAFTDAGIFIFENSTGSFKATNYHRFFKSPDIVDAMLDTKRRLWIIHLSQGMQVIDFATRKSLIVWDQKRNKEWFDDAVLKEIEQDKNGKIWIAGCSNAVVVFDESMSIFVKVKDLKSNAGKSFAGMCINKLSLNEDGSLLVASWGGINKLDNSGKILTTFDYEHDKMVDTYCSNIGEDEKGNLWFSTNEGIHIANPSNRTIKRFTSVEGLSNNISFGFLMNKKRELLVGYNNSFDVLNIRELNSGQFVPNIAVSSVDVVGKKRNHDISENLMLERDENTVSFSFSTLNFDPPSKNSYQYQLEGFDKRWIDLGNKNRVTFTNLDPKSYVLKVKSGSSIGVWNEKPILIHLTVKPAFYETWWFKILMALLILGGVFQFIRWRLNAIQEKNRMAVQMSDWRLRALRSQMNPHFLFNALNSIRSCVMNGQQAEATNYLTKFSKLLRIILVNSAKNKIPLSDELLALKLYLEVESLRFSGNFEYEIQINEDVDADLISIPPMLIQPYVENAIWHGLLNKSGDRQLTISVAEVENKLQIIIQDNGVGRDAAALHKQMGHKSLGTQLTEERLQLLGADATAHTIDLYDDTHAPAGTCVVLTLPI